MDADWMIDWLWPNHVNNSFESYPGVEYAGRLKQFELCRMIRRERGGGDDRISAPVADTSDDGLTPFPGLSRIIPLWKCVAGEAKRSIPSMSSCTNSSNSQEIATPRQYFLDKQTRQCRMARGLTSRASVLAH
jgi:hypothetical protein